MYITITDREGIGKGLKMPGPYVIISIHDPHKSPARIRHDPLICGVLTLNFLVAHPIYGSETAEQMKVFTNQEADTIWDFLDKHLSQIEGIVVHCESGTTRSPAIAAAISEALGLDHVKFLKNYDPSMHVYHTVLNAHERRKNRRDKV